jgi:SAM-dependent methyltransferase
MANKPKELPFGLAARRGMERAVAIVLMSACPVLADGADAILEASGVWGGLAVVIGCDHPKLLTDLRSSGSFLVHALDTDPAKVAQARRHIRGKKLYGPVSAATFDGKSLPYADGLVNLLIVRSGERQVTGEEAARVLTPLGTVVATAAFRPAPPSLVPRRSAALRDAFIATEWAVTPDFQARAMLKAGDLLFTAGPPAHRFDEQTAGDYSNGDYQEWLRNQFAAEAGKQGASLLAVSAKDGKVLRKVELDAPPVFDGMAAAFGRLFVALKNGTVVSYK